MVPVRLLVPILLACLLVVSCVPQPGDLPTLDRYTPLLRMGVSLAVDRLLTQQPDLVHMTIHVSAVLVDMFDAGDFTSIAQVGAFIRAKIPWDKIGPDARPLIEALLVGIGEELRVLAQQHQIPETQAVLLVEEMLSWVTAAAQRHLVAPVRAQRVAR